MCVFVCVRARARKGGGVMGEMHYKRPFVMGKMHYKRRALTEQTDSDK